MKIYKYLSKDGAIESLKTNSVLLKCPVDYNDPFDCLFYVDEKEKKRAYKLFINYYLFKEMYKLFYIEKKEPVNYKTYAKILKANIGQIAKNLEKTKRYTYQADIGMYQKLASMMVKTNLDEMQNKFDEMIEDVLPHVRETALVSCFGLDNKSVLMWSHYGEKHEGACFEYEVPDNDVYKEIKYNKKLPIFKLVKLMQVILGHDFVNEKIDTNNDLYSFALEPLLTKSNDWKYEKEARCVFSKSEINERIFTKDDKILLRMPKPTKIYLGCKAPESFVDELKGYSGEIPIDYMKIAVSNYKVE